MASSVRGMWTWRLLECGACMPNGWIGNNKKGWILFVCYLPRSRSPCPVSSVVLWQKLSIAPRSFSRSRPTCRKISECNHNNWRVATAYVSQYCCGISNIFTVWKSIWLQNNSEKLLWVDGNLLFVAFIEREDKATARRAWSWQAQWLREIFCTSFDRFVDRVNTTWHIRHSDHIRFNLRDEVRPWFCRGIIQ